MFSANLEIVSQLSKLSLPEFSGVYVSVYLKASPHEDGYDMMPLAWLHTFFLMEYMFEGCFKVKRVKRVNISVTHSLFLTHLQMSLWTYGVLQDCLTVITEDQGCKGGGGKSPTNKNKNNKKEEQRCICVWTYTCRNIPHTQIDSLVKPGTPATLTGIILWQRERVKLGRDKPKPRKAD